jgi:hypothetical protein
MNSECRPPSFPARPVNGGPLEKALPKNGIWAYEPKINGWRAWLHTPTGAMFNRKNEPLSIAREFDQVINRVKSAAAVDANGGLPLPEWLDVEALERRLPIGKGSLVILDSPLAGTWSQRQEYLHSSLVTGGTAQSWAFEQFPPPENKLLMFAYHYEDEHAQVSQGATVIDFDLFPQAAWKLLPPINRRLGCELFEGLVAKRLDSIYPMQLRSPEVEFPFWLKHRWAL